MPPPAPANCTAHKLECGGAITSIVIEEILGIDYAIDVLSRNGSIEQRQLEEL